MRIYSDNRLSAVAIAAAAPVGTYVDQCDPISRPRSRRRGWNVRLANPNRNRYRNSGTHGAGAPGAASWDDYGSFFAALFQADPDARIGPYDGRKHFHILTRCKYLTCDRVQP